MIIFFRYPQISEANDCVSPKLIWVLKTLDETDVIEEEGLLGEKDCAVVGSSDCEEVV